MKVALIINDKTTEDSFYVNSGTAYRLGNDHEYLLPSSQSSTLARNVWTIPFLYNDGCFLSGTRQLPAVDFDVIFAVAENELLNTSPGFLKRIKNYHRGMALPSEVFLKRLRKRYPNAAIIGFPKEFNPAYNLNLKAKKFLAACDRVATIFPESSLAVLRKLFGIRVHPFYIPYDIDRIRQQFKEKPRRDYIFVAASKAVETSSVGALSGASAAPAAASASAAVFAASIPSAILAAAAPSIAAIAPSNSGEPPVGLPKSPGPGGGPPPIPPSAPTVKSPGIPAIASGGM